MNMFWKELTKTNICQEAYLEVSNNILPYKYIVF